MSSTVRPVWTDETIMPRRGLEAWLPPKPRELVYTRNPVDLARLNELARQLAAQQAGASTDPNRLADAEAERIPDWVYTGERP